MTRVLFFLVCWPLALFAQVSPHGPLSMACNECHTTASWKTVAVPSSFDHDTTSFPLRGAHRQVSCIGCHTNLRFQGTPTACIGCHRADFRSALTVDHVLAGFSTDCTQCHTSDQSSWLVSFDHDKTDFPTRGAHAALPCTACHANNRFRGTPIECYACHQADYQATTNPNHRDAGFNTECATCHRALTWRPATFFPHDNFFPISDGTTHHPGVWNTCNDCHLTQPAYASFECIYCHEHSKDRTDGRHSNVSGYEYKSSACYRCHPRP